jgi:phage gpG-like protein
VAVKIKDVDKGLARLLVDLKSLKGYHAKVGIQGDKAATEHEGSGLTIAEVGAVHEYGAPSVGIPQRSFLRATLDADPEKWRKELSTQVNRVLKEGAKPKQAMMVVAEKLRAAVLKAIDDKIPPPLADATVDRKGHDTPLIDSGILRGAITAEVGENEDV